MLVDRPEAREDLVEMVPADRHHQRQADAESIEYRPPTQSQKPNMFVGVDAELDHLGRRSSKPRRNAGDSRLAARAPRSPSRARPPFAIVSIVVNVFEATMNIVAPG